MPSIPQDVYRFFRFMREHIELESNGMGVSLRESKANIKKLLKTEGYEYKYYKDFIMQYESKLLTQYHDKQEKDKK